MNETQRDYYKLEKLWSGMLGPAGHLPDADLAADTSFEEEADEDDEDDDDDEVSLVDEFGEAEISGPEPNGEQDPNAPS
jgi:hypothetical protein